MYTYCPRQADWSILPPCSDIARVKKPVVAMSLQIEVLGGNALVRRETGIPTLVGVACLCSGRDSSKR